MEESLTLEVALVTESDNSLTWNGIPVPILGAEGGGELEKALATFGVPAYLIASERLQQTEAASAKTMATAGIGSKPHSLISKLL